MLIRNHVRIITAYNHGRILILPTSSETIPYLQRLLRTRNTNQYVYFEVLQLLLCVVVNSVLDLLFLLAATFATPGVNHRYYILLYTVYNNYL